MERDRSTQIEEYRSRFRSAPVGTWETAQGTFDAVQSQVITFHPDQTGTIDDHRSLSGSGPVRFEWREKEERVIEVRYSDDESEAEEPWDEIRYDFKIKEGDTGSEVVLYEVGHDGFWDSAAPLRKF